METRFTAESLHFLDTQLHLLSPDRLPPSVQTPHVTCSPPSQSFRLPYSHLVFILWCLCELLAHKSAFYASTEHAHHRAWLYALCYIQIEYIYNTYRNISSLHLTSMSVVSYYACHCFYGKHSHDEHTNLFSYHNRPASAPGCYWLVMTLWGKKWW